MDILAVGGIGHSATLADVQGSKVYAVAFTTSLVLRPALLQAYRDPEGTLRTPGRRGLMRGEARNGPCAEDSDLLLDARE